jgi:hypothetical protein
MSVRKADVVAALSVHEPQVLRAILEAADISLRNAETSPDLATRIADQLWWHYCTPFGYVIEVTTLDEMIEHLIKRLQVQHVNEAGDAWNRLRSLTVQLARTTATRIDIADPARGVSLEDLDDNVRGRMSTPWAPAVGAAAGGVASFGAGVAGKVVVAIGKTPIGRLLPLIPTIGPIWKGVRTVGGVAAVVGTPLGIGLSVVALNESFSTNYAKFVPLLLGVGALGPTAVENADEVPAS